MTKIVVPPIIPGAIPEDRFAQNGDIPAPAALRRAAWAYNHVSNNQRKLLHASANFTQSTPAPADASENSIIFCFRTGSNVESVAMVVGMAPASQANGTSPAGCLLRINDGSTTTNGPTLYYPKVASGIYPPSDIAWSWSEITVADGLVADTEYRGSLQQDNYCRVHSLMVYETALTVGVSSAVGVADPLYWEANKPIYDAGVQDLAQTGTELWRHNACQLLSWSRKDAASAPTVSGTTWANIMQTGTSAYSATAPGFVLNTQYHDTAKGDVPLVLGVYATRTVGSTGTLEIRLEQAAGTLLTKTGIGTTMTPFNSSTHTVAAAASTKTDIHARCSNGDTWRIDAIGLWEYEA